jgi:hypothetical protein
MLQGTTCSGCSKDFKEIALVTQHISGGHCKFMPNILVPGFATPHTQATGQLTVEYEGQTLPIERVHQFVLGRTVCDNDDDTPAVHTAICKGWQAVYALKRNVFTRHLSKDVRVRIFNAVALSRVLYCCESWVLTTKTARALDAFQQKGLRHCLRMFPHIQGDKPHYPRRADVLAAAGLSESLSDTVRRRSQAFLAEVQGLPPTSTLHQFIHGAVLGTSKSNTGISRLTSFLYDTAQTWDSQDTDDLVPATPGQQNDCSESHMAPTGT